MKKGIRCHETQKISRQEQICRINFDFVTRDGNTPSSASVALGDVDPVTGEKIPDITFFRQHGRDLNHEVYVNQKERNAIPSKEEKILREQEKEKIIREFTRDHGYAPNKDNQNWLLEQRFGSRAPVSYDALRNEEGESDPDCDPMMADPTVEAAFTAVEEGGLFASIRIFQGTLFTDREKDELDMYVANVVCGRTVIRKTDLARKWGARPQNIDYELKKVISRLREWLTKEGYGYHT